MKYQKYLSVVLEPQFEVETKSYFFGIYKRTQVNVVGWGANIKSFKDGSHSNNVERFSGTGSYCGRRRMVISLV